MRGGLGRAVRAARILAGDRRLPRPLRWVAGLALLPIPGPVDEVALLLLVPVFLACYRQPLRDSWSEAHRPTR